MGMRLGVGVVLGATAVLAAVVPAEATLTASSNRIAGPDRYATAALVAEATFEQAPVALLANGRSYADGLSASYLSGGLAAPLLLTEVDALPDGVIDAFGRLGTERVVIVGGSGAVSDGVVASLEARGLQVSRISGSNRYATAREVAGSFATSSIGQIDGGRAAIVATGEGFADALAVAPLGSSSGVPILLTTSASLHSDTRAGLEELGIQRVLVVGGPVAVSAAVESSIISLGIGVRRIAGATRQETAMAVASFATEHLGYAMDRVLLARGDQFADALAAGTRGGRLRAPVLLVTGHEVLGDDLRRFLKEHVETLTTVDVLGGIDTISEAVADDAEEAARGR